MDGNRPLSQRRRLRERRRHVAPIDARPDADWAMDETDLIDALPLSDSSVAAHLERLKGESPRQREDAIRHLGELRIKEAVSALVRCLQDEYPKVRAAAADALGRIGEAAATDALLERLTDRNRDVRFRAAYALEHVKPPISIEMRVRIWKHVVAQDPQNLYALCNLSLALHDDGATDAAIEALERAIEFHSGHYYPYLLVGQLFVEMRRRAAAIYYYKCALRRNPECASAHLELGNLYRDAGDDERACACYRKAVELAPAESSAYFHLGFCSQRIGRYEEAIEAYQRCTVLDPDNEMAYNNLGMALRAVGRHAEAMDAFKQALRVNPEYEEAQLNLGDTYLFFDRGSEEPLDDNGDDG